MSGLRAERGCWGHGTGVPTEGECDFCRLEQANPSHILGSYDACIVCGEQTRWIEINYHAHLCPGSCTVWIDYEAARA